VRVGDGVWVEGGLNGWLAAGLGNGLNGWLSTDSGNGLNGFVRLPGADVRAAWQRKAGWWKLKRSRSSVH
jgi:hypothetical protein